MDIALRQRELEGLRDAKQVKRAKRELQDLITRLKQMYGAVSRAAYEGRYDE
jgi:hypothetical protein